MKTNFEQKAHDIQYRKKDYKNGLQLGEDDGRFFDELDPIMAIGTFIMVAFGIGLLVALI